MEMDKLTELQREYWMRVVDMCEDTNVKPWECVKYSRFKFSDHPNFQGIHRLYKFAVAILEDKPVFVGDILYRIKDGHKAIVDNFVVKLLILDFDNNPALWEPSSLPDNFTWAPPAPKRTFVLNGEDMPCPVSGIDDPAIYIRKSDGNGTYFQFHSVADRDNVLNALINLLTEARDK